MYKQTDLQQRGRELQKPKPNPCVNTRDYLCRKQISPGLMLPPFVHNTHHIPRKNDRRTLLCHGFKCSSRIQLCFLITQEPSWVPKGLVSHLIMLLVTGRVSTKQPLDKEFHNHNVTWDFRFGTTWGSIFSWCSIKSKQQQKYCKIQSSDRGG